MQVGRVELLPQQLHMWTLEQEYFDLSDKLGAQMVCPP